ncbi:hypothetical protein FI667_g12523, partial [Globisporangium splendens]
MADLEALAAQCRSDAFRQTLATSNVWLRVECTLDDAIAVLRQNVVVVGNNSSDIASATANGAGGHEGEGNEDDDGLGFTIRVNKSQVQHGALDADFAATSVEVRGDAAKVSKQVEVATSAFRLLRIASFVLLSQVALQFLVNCVTGYEANQAIVWQLFFPDHFQDTDNSAVHARRVDLVCARNLVITMLQRCLVKPAASSEAASTVHSLRIDDAQQQDPAFEWLCLLFRVLFETNFAKDLYNAVGAHMLSKLWSRVTPEQLILLRMLTMWITSATSPTKQSRRESDDQLRDVAPSSAQGTAATQCAFVSTAFFEFVKHTWVYVITVSDEDRPEETEEVRKQMWRELENDAKLLLLDMMGEITQDASVIFSDDAELLLVSLLEELQRVWQLRHLGEVPVQAATNAPVARTSSFSDPENASGEREPFGYRSGMIRAIGNLCFRHTRHQDIVREQGYLVLFLNHCNIDDVNPMVREWSLVALRNLCEGNEANQQYINALKPQSTPSGASAPPGS